MYTSAVVYHAAKNSLRRGRRQAHICSHSNPCARAKRPQNCHRTLTVRPHFNPRPLATPAFGGRILTELLLEVAPLRQGDDDMWNVIMDSVGIKSMKREHSSDQMALREDEREELVEWAQSSPLRQMALKRSGSWSEGHSDGDGLDDECEEDTVSDDSPANDLASCCVSERFLSDVVKSAPPAAPCVKYKLGSKVRFLLFSNDSVKTESVPAGGCGLQDTRYCLSSASCVTCACAGESIVYPATVVSIGREGYCLRTCNACAPVCV